MIRPLLAVLSALTLAACATAPRPAPVAAEAPPPAVHVREVRPPVTILVSIDGFRADYLKRGITPRLSKLAADGAHAAMRPSFPSVTFPNHYTLVTGLRPDRNGIVGNKMEDPAKPGVIFDMSNADPFWWKQTEPLWITAEKAGLRTATMFWPGSNVDFDGVRPRDWQFFNENVTARQRVDGIVDWLRRPAATRPQFLTLYFDNVDHAGHDFGPDDPRTNAEVTRIDGEIGRLVDELAVLGQSANLIIVADHGMAGTSPDRVVPLWKIARMKDYRALYAGPYAAIAAQPGREARLAKALLKPHPHMTCTRKADVPPALHYGQNLRVPAFICVAEIGWMIKDVPPTPDKPIKPGGAHGYDPANHEMDALFIANGPAFRPGIELPQFDNVDVYPLLTRLIGVTGHPSDGTDAVFAPALRP